MDFVVRTMKDGGPFMFYVLPTALLALILAIATVAFAAAARERSTVRLLSVLTLVFAAAVVGLGAAGRAMGIEATHAALPHVPEDQQEELLAEGTREANIPLQAAWPPAAFAAVCAAV